MVALSFHEESLLFFNTMTNDSIRQGELSSEKVTNNGCGSPVGKHRCPWLVLLCIIFLAALIPRILYVVQIQNPPFSDMADYDRCAMNFLLGDGLVQSQDYKAYRTPGYPLLLAMIYLIADHNVLTVRLVQSVIGALTAVLTALLARKAFARVRRRDLWAFLSGMVLALSDESVFFCGQLLTETLFTFLFVIWLLLVLKMLSKPGAGSCAGLAALHGVLILVRPVAWFFVPVVWWLFLQHRPKLAKAWKTCGLYGLIVAAVIAPWTLRNYKVTGHFIPTSTNDGVNFYIGHNPAFE